MRSASHVVRSHAREAGRTLLLSLAVSACTSTTAQPQPTPTPTRSDDPHESVVTVEEAWKEIEAAKDAEVAKAAADAEAAELAKMREAVKAAEAEAAKAAELALVASWQPVAEPQYIHDRLLDSTADSARYALENDRLHYQLELRARDDSATLTLTERDTGHALEHEWSTVLCGPEFFDSDAGVVLVERAHDSRGRKLLHLWATCQLGEDIVATSTIVLIVLVDADGLSKLWSGHASSHTSHVCGEWQEIEVEVEPSELVITEYDRAKIFLPAEIPGYDCDENSREYDTVRVRHRIELR